MIGRFAKSESTTYKSEAISPVRVLLLILLVVFAVEAGIMVVLSPGAMTSRATLVVGLVDSLTLVAALAPALWLMVVRPLRKMAAERGELLARTLTIQEQERAKLARDLHDELGQVQTAILLGLRAVANAETVEEARARTVSVQAMAVEAVETSRRLARGLSPSVLADFGLALAVERVCEDVAAASGVEIVRELAIGEVRPAAATEIAAYRVVQEALTNAVKHSGATKIVVTMKIEKGKLHLTITDNGHGIVGGLETTKATGKRLGLAGMRERVVLLGGVFAMRSTASSGTTLSATLPV